MSSAELYKSQGIHSKEYRQSERRHALLELQRQRRNDLIDEHRSIEPLKKIFRKQHHHHHQPQSHSKYQSIKNQLMLSEWLKEVPDDIDNWYLKPCPKGVRVLVIAVDGTTRVFNKYGAFMRRFRSELPGDHRNKRDLLTILDCIYVASLDEYLVLDVIAYGQQALTDCETEFRFFWIESQIRESNLDQVSEHNEYPFRIIDKCNCGDEVALNEFLSKYPIWPNNEPQLDGFLFYHKEASYVHGKTPLVGWLFAFMIPELFNVPHINEKYLIDKPADYTNYLTFIETFDENLREKRKNRRNNRIEDMQVGTEEIETTDKIDPISILKETMELEMNDTNDTFGTSDDQHLDANSTDELEMSH